MTLAALAALVLLASSSAHPAPSAGAPSTPAPRHEEGVHATGAHWAIDMPEKWNGTLLLYARGYRPAAAGQPPSTAPRDSREWLLAQGYALAASSYSGSEWALQEAPHDQIDVLDTFIARHGRPRRVIAWGDSMGGLVTVALAERFGDRIDGALAACGSTAGSLGMLNTALDGAFAFRTLLASDSDIRIVGVDDDRANGARVAVVLKEALKTPQGRARVALASVLGQIPPWTDPAASEPAPNDHARQLEEATKSFVPGVFLPRKDQETRAGGVYSWNTSVDYAAQLRASDRGPFVAALYREAGLDLASDLAALNATPRIAADPLAVAYMRTNYVPTGKLKVPVLTLHEIGDGLTLANIERSFADAVAAAAAQERLGQLFVRAAGHCRFTLAERIAALRTLEARLDSSRWTLAPAAVTRRAQGIEGALRFVTHRPRPLLRACGAVPGSCSGEPTPTAANERPFDGHQRRSQYVTVRDGTRIAVALFFPLREGAIPTRRLPVILMHALGPRPRDLNGRLNDFGVPQLLRRGYVIAWMEPRGFGASFGAATPFLTRQNGRDAADVIEWLGTQPWSNGRVAMYGLSNMGYAQWLTAVERPRHLVAIAPSVANPDFYYQLYPNGVSALAGAPTRAGQGPLGEPVDDDPPPHPLATAAHAEHLANRTLRDAWLSNMARDQVNPKLGYAPGLVDSVLPAHAGAVRGAGLAIFQHAGWFDSSPRGQLLAWKAFGGRITLGAWRHGLFAEQEGGAVIRAEILPWFDEVLRGLARVEASPIRYQTINAPAGEDWRYAADWPLPNEKRETYYLAPGSASLAPKKPPGAQRVSVRVDPELAAFDGRFNRLARVWDGDMSAHDARGLAFTSAPLAADLEITGHPVLDVWITADAPDVNVVAYLEEVEAGGRVRFITDGAMRASHRAQEEASPWRELGLPYHPSTEASLKPLTPGEPVQLSFDLQPTSYIFRAGSRIRVTITGGECTAYEQPAGFDPGAPPTLSVLAGPAHASRISLPVIPRAQ